MHLPDSTTTAYWFSDQMDRSPVFSRTQGNAYSLLFSIGSMANLPRGERAGLGIIGASIRERCSCVNPTHDTSGRQGNVLWLSSVLCGQAAWVHDPSFTTHKCYDHGANCLTEQPLCVSVVSFL